MTVASLIARNDYTGTDTTGPFPYYFRILAATDLSVTVHDTATGLDTVLVYPADFAVSGVGDRAGGAVTLTQSISSTETLSIRRRLPILQPTELRNQGAYPPESIETALDRSVMMLQEHEDRIERSVMLSDAYDPAAYDLQLPTPTPGAALVWNVDATGFDNGILSDAQLSAWSAAHNQKLDTYVAATHFTAGVTTQLTLTDPPGDIANVSITRRTSGVDYPVMTDEYGVDADGVITFTNPIPAATTRIEARYFYTYQLNTALARNVRLTLGGGRLIRSLESYLDNNATDFNVHDFGAVGDGVTDDTAAIQAAIDEAWKVGGCVRFKALAYAYTHLVLPTAAASGTLVNTSLALVGVQANWMGEEYNVNRRYGTRLIQTVADGGDAIAAVSTVFSRPTYRFENLSLVGPDTSSPRTTGSGHGIRISGTATAFVRMNNVAVSLFYGSGKVALWLDNVEVSQFDRIHCSANNINLKLTGATNNCGFHTVSLEYAAEYQAWLEGSEGGVWDNLLVQHSEKTGLHFKGYANAVFNATYCEGNNSTAAAGRYAIEFESAVNFSTSNVQFTSTIFNGPGDQISAVGVAGWTVNRIRFINVKGSGLGTPAVLLGAFCDAWVLDGVCPPSSVTDTSNAQNHRITWLGAEEYTYGRPLTMANNATQFLGASIRGFIDVATDDWQGGRFFLQGPANATVKISDSSGGMYTTVKGTAASLNCYYDAAGANGAGYYLQNTRGGARDVGWHIVRL